MKLEYLDSDNRKNALAISRVATDLKVIIKKYNIKDDVITFILNSELISDEDKYVIVSNFKEFKIILRS